MKSILIFFAFFLVSSCGLNTSSHLNGVTEDNERLTKLVEQRNDFIRDFYAHNPNKKLYSPKKGSVSHIDVSPGIYKVTEVFEDLRLSDSAYFEPEDRINHDVSSEELYITTLPRPKELEGRSKIDRASRLYSYLKTVSKTKTFGSLFYGTFGNEVSGKSWATIFNQAIDENFYQHVAKVKYPVLGLTSYLIDEASRSTLEILLKRFDELKKIGTKFRPVSLHLTGRLAGGLCDIERPYDKDMLQVTLSREATELSSEKFNSLIDHIVDYGTKAASEGIFMGACRGFTI